MYSSGESERWGGCWVGSCNVAAQLPAAAAAAAAAAASASSNETTTISYQRYEDYYNDVNYFHLRTARPSDHRTIASLNDPIFPAAML